MTERVSKLNLVIPIVRKEAQLVKEAIIQALKPFTAWVHTITLDNGREYCGNIFPSNRRWIKPLNMKLTWLSMR